MSNSTLKKFIQRCLLEAADEELSTDQRAIGGHSQRLADLRKEYGIETPGVNDQINWQELLADDDFLQTYSDRREIKGHWNDRAYSSPEREQFWTDGSKIICVHWLGLLDYKNADYVEITKKYIQFIQSPSSRPPELSCIGHYQSISTPISPMGIIIDPRRITFAYAGDAYTQQINTATEDIEAMFAGSGLPKHPSTQFSAKRVMFSEEDIIRNNVDWLGEVVVDNYQYGEFVISARWLGKSLENVKQLITDSGLNFKIL
tara:strand:- start:307 stop:1086 length:780 start_codon:yes stop_codon:yes gene_type:complete